MARGVGIPGLCGTEVEITQCGTMELLTVMVESLKVCTGEWNWLPHVEVPSTEAN